VVRKQVQNEREKVQHTTSFLERQAKKSVKELEDKEKSLINFYKIKESRFEEMRMVAFTLCRKRKIEGELRISCKIIEEQTPHLERTRCIGGLP
jgi:hypothetical protein